MKDQELPPLDSDIRALIARTRPFEPAPPAARMRALDRVAFAAASRGPGPGVDSAARAPSSAPARAALASRVGWLVGTFVIGTIVGGVAVHSVDSRRAPAISQRVAAVEPPSAPALPSSAPAPSSAPLVVGAALPRPGVPSGSVRAAPTPHANGALAAEGALLDAARSAIEREDGAAALAATSEHERRFPDGLLVQEREAMAVRALLLVGRADEARARAAKFQARFPDSMLLPALQSSLAAPPP
jgi:hypothetical protein